MRLTSHSSEVFGWETTRVIDCRLVTQKLSLAFYWSSNLILLLSLILQAAFTCSKSTMQASEQHNLFKTTNPANVGLGEGTLQTSWRRLEGVFSVRNFCLPRRPQDNFKTCLQNKTFSWRRFEDVLQTSCEDILKINLEEFLEDENLLRWRCLQDVFKTSWKTKNVCREICSKITMNTPERRHWRCSDVFIVNSEEILHVALIFPLLTLNKQMPADVALYCLYQWDPAFFLGSTSFRSASYWILTRARLANNANMK